MVNQKAGEGRTGGGLGKGIGCDASEVRSAFECAERKALVRRTPLFAVIGPLRLGSERSWAINASLSRQ